MTRRLANGAILAEIDSSWAKLSESAADGVLVGVNKFASDEVLAALSTAVDYDAIAERFDDDREPEVGSYDEACSLAKDGYNVDQLSSGLRRGYAAAIEPMPNRRLATELGWEPESQP